MIDFLSPSNEIPVNTIWRQHSGHSDDSSIVLWLTEVINRFQDTVSVLGEKKLIRDICLFILMTEMIMAPFKFGRNQYSWYFQPIPTHQPAHTNHTTDTSCGGWCLTSMIPSRPAIYFINAALVSAFIHILYISTKMPTIHWQCCNGQGKDVCALSYGWLCHGIGFSKERRGTNHKLL